MLSKAQWVLLLSLFAWGWVVYRLVSTKSSREKEQLSNIKSLQNAHQSTFTRPTYHKSSVQSEMVISLLSKHNATVNKEERKVSHVNSFLRSEKSGHSGAKEKNASDEIVKSRSVNDFKVNRLPWMEFVELSLPSLAQSARQPPDALLSLHSCSAEISSRLGSSLSEDELKWCRWALSEGGGRVKVGKSYGILNAKDREKYERLNCNAAQLDLSPSCSLAWGDAHAKYWGENLLPTSTMCGDSELFTSRVYCRDSHNKARFCEFRNIMVDVSKMHNVRRMQGGMSRKWDKGFLSTHCAVQDIDYYDFYAAKVDAEQSYCDYVLDTMVLFGHDNIKNLGHSLSDFMNVWLMLWLSNLGDKMKGVTFLNADAIRMGHNYYDDLGKFGRHYELAFREVLKLSDFPTDAKLCVKQLLFMPRPLVLFTWDGWWQDMPCSFLGPSSLFQRWNINIRQNYRLLSHTSNSMIPITAQNQGSDVIRILLLERRASSSIPQQSSRVLSNAGDALEALRKIEGVDVTLLDLSSLSFEEQIRKVHGSDVIVGIHGAGIASAMHMRIGEKNCCGVLEIFPMGEFFPIRGYGNMARRMGLRYRRVELSSGESLTGGVRINLGKLVAAVSKMVEEVKGEASCVLPEVLQGPFFTRKDSVIN